MATFEELIDTVGARVNAKADEAIRDVMHRMPWGQKVTMADGTQATIKLLVGSEWPKRDADGRLYFTFDLACDEGCWHVEFQVKHTGWGGAP